MKLGGGGASHEAKGRGGAPEEDNSIAVVSIKIIIILDCLIFMISFITPSLLIG